MAPLLKKRKKKHINKIQITCSCLFKVMEQHRTSPFDLDSTQQSLVSDSVMESDSQNSSKGIVSSIESKEIANSSKTARLVKYKAIQKLKQSIL